MDVLEMFLFGIFLGALNRGCFAVSAQSDVSTACPSTYKEGEEHLINCTINSANVAAAMCKPGGDVVQFYLSGNNGKESACNTLHNKSTCTPASSGVKCGCVNKNGDIFTYQFRFVAENKHQSQSLRCEVPCKASGTEYSTGKACDSVSFVSGSSARQVPPSVSARPFSPSNGGRNYDCGWLSLGFASLTYLILP